MWKHRMLKSVKPKNQRSKRALEKRAPKIHENTKSSLCLRGPTSSDIVNQALTDIFMLRKPNSQNFTKKNNIRPFEDETSLEFLCQKNDCSLFAVGSHNKKRPHNITFGRMYDFHVLDMFELGIDNFSPLSAFPASAKQALGSKPCMIFQGEDFENKIDYQKLKNLFVDFFRGHAMDHFNLAGVDNVMVFTSVGGKILMRHYAIVLKKSGQKLPRVELEEMGPSMDMTLRRSKLPSTDAWKHAIKVPSGAKPKKEKNISHNEFHDKVGRIHMHRQDYDKLGLHKFKGMGKGTAGKRTRGEDGEQGAGQKRNRKDSDVSA